MARPKTDDAYPEIDAAFIAGESAQLASALASYGHHAQRWSSAGGEVYADAARWHLTLIKERLAKIETAVAKMPTMKREPA